MLSMFSFASKLLSLLLLTQLINNIASSVLNDDADVSISNLLVDYKQRSSREEEWRICIDWQGFAKYYCPTVPTVNFLQMMEGLAYERSRHYVSNITTDCFTCSSVNTDCETFLDGGKDTNECSVDDPCTPGSHFCDYKSDDDFALNISGTCKACPSELDECYEDGFLTSHRSKLNCHLCSRMWCHNAQGEATVTMNGERNFQRSQIYVLSKTRSRTSRGPSILDGTSAAEERNSLD
eukprot:scaffold62802_cov22-Cyclotella_meneghiniana.AAC.1